MTSSWIVRRLAVTACLFGAWTLVSAQSVSSRIFEEINPNNTVALPGSVSPRIAPQFQVGRMSPSTPIDGITLNFALTAEQKAELDALVQAQLTPGNPEYHQWLTPAQYAAQFGLSQADIAKVEGWLQSEGFNIDRVANSRTSITFSGTVEQVETAFQTQMGRYLINGESHWANATSLSIPAALEGVVLSVGNLNDFRPHSMVRFSPRALTAKSAFTSAQSGDHFLTPGDVAVIYGLKAAYQAGNTGTGVTIAIMGQSAITTADVQNFDSAAGLTFNQPNLILVPGSGASTTYEGDEAESDLDTEYSGAVAQGATIDFVYTGNNPNDDVFNSLQYAVDNRIGSVISISYGACETGLSATDFSALEQVNEQGASQGQTIIASAGDSGSTSCYGYTNLTTAQQEALVANYPASSAYATALGGTEFSAADVASTNSAYWNNSTGSGDVVTSALSYIPESTWNDDPTCGAAATKYDDPGGALCAGGGGVSVFAARPSWQTGVTGITGSQREVPDISLDSSNVNAPYLFCTSDQSAWSAASGGTPAQAASCNSGFRDSTSQDLTAAGGTSFAAPIFAGMMAIVDQKTGSDWGIAAAELYKLAANSTTYASAFNDITSTSTSGGNQCTAGSSYCSSAGASEYAAATGYDEATGLGSVNFSTLLSAWVANTTPSTVLTTTAATAASPTVAAGSTDALAITVTAASGTPTGSVAIWDGTTEQNSTQIGTATLANGVASFPYSPTSATYSGTHVLEVVYSPASGSTYAGSSATVQITVTGGTAPPTFALTASNVTVTTGSSGTSTITVTSQNSYAGTVSFASPYGGLYVTSTNGSGLDNGCYAISASGNSSGNVTVSANSSGTATLTFYTSTSSCSSSGAAMRPGFFRIRQAGANGSQARNRSPFGGAVPIAASALAGLLLFGFRRSRSKLWTTLGCLMLMVALTGFVSGCGGSSGGTTGCVGSACTTSTGSDVTPGTYTLELVGSDISNGAINGQASLTLTVNQ